MRQARSHQGGYVLLFALGLLTLVATLILGVSVGQRLDAQLLGHEKSAIQDRYLLAGAARLTAVELGLAQDLLSLQPPLSEERLQALDPWIPGTGSRIATLDGVAVSVQLQDVTGLPDANLLTQQQWARLYLLVGAATEQQAQQLAQQTVALRSTLARMRASAGFAGLEELLQWENIPAGLVAGGSERAPLGLKDLLVVGSNSQSVNLDTTPLPLLPILGKVSAEQLQQLATLRTKGAITSTQAQQWLQGTGLTAYPAGSSPAVVRARLRLASAPADGSVLVATLARRAGSFSVVDLSTEQGLTSSP